MPTKDTAPTPKPSVKSPVALPLAVTTGCVVALVLARMILPAVFGVEHRSIWLLSDNADVLAGLVCLPVFVATHLLTYRALRSRGKIFLHCAAIATFAGLVFFLPVVVGFWHWQGAQKVLRAR